MGVQDVGGFLRGDPVDTSDARGPLVVQGAAGAGTGGAAATPSYETHAVTGISDGRKVVTTAGTRVVLAASTAAKYVTVTAETDNTGLIVVGGTTVVAVLATRQGTPLNAGESYGPFPVDNLNDVNLDSTVSGEGVTFTYFT